MSENFEINQLYNLSSANNSPNQTQDSNKKKLRQVTQQLDFNDPNVVLQLAQNWANEEKRRKEAEKIIEIQAPKVAFAEAIVGSKNSILIGELSTLLKQNGINIGQNRLFEWLRANGYLISKKSISFNMPTQKAMNLELFEIKEKFNLGVIQV